MRTPEATLRLLPSVPLRFSLCEVLAPELEIPGVLWTGCPLLDTLGLVITLDFLTWKPSRTTLPSAGASA